MSTLPEHSKCPRLVQKMRVAFQGERGAYSEEATRILFGEIEVQPCPALRDVFTAVAGGGSDAGVVPMENSQAGSINETYDLLLSNDLPIVSELNLRIRHCLLALPGQALPDLRTVYSHPQAIAQCEEFLLRHGLTGVPEQDTAGSARWIADQQIAGAGAIASHDAAHIYGLQILAEGIETNAHNITKFLAIARTPAPRGKLSKTSIVFTTQNVPGALYQALGTFAMRSINLTKLESRPRREVPWEYVFYVDFEGHHEDADVAAALQDLRALCTFVRVLGSYPRSAGPA